MLFFLILNIFFASCQDDDKLIFTMIHMRHGARSPVVEGQRDIFGEEWENPGELTPIGERMHYNLGLRNRNRYVTEKKLLSEKYDPSELVLMTTDYKRTIVSLSSHLQGLYPHNKNLGNSLTDNQIQNSKPPVDCSKVQDEINALGNSALPNSMTLIPFEIRHNSNFTGLYAQNGCKGAMKYYSTADTENMRIAKNEFQEKYAQFVDEARGTAPHNYSFLEIVETCDPYIADYVDGRNMAAFRNTGVNMDDFLVFCYKMMGLYETDYSIRGEETIYLEGSKIMELLINNIKKSIDADNNSQKSPKLLIYSAHDLTLTKQELFMYQTLENKYDEKYIVPTYASQMAFEVSRKDDGNTNRKYSDYTVNYYFNDDLKLSKTADEFINIMEPNIWSDEKIDQFCANTPSDNTDNPTTNPNGNNGNSTEGNEGNKNNKAKIANNYSFSAKNKQKSYKAPFIVMTCLFGASILAIAFLSYLLFRKSTDYAPQESSVYSTNIKN